MAYRDRVLENIERSSPADLEDVVRFRAAAYGPDVFFSEPGYVHWMYERAAPGHEPSPLWIFRAEGEIEGQQGSRRVTLHVDGQAYEGLWSTELVVSPEYLMRGVGAIMSGVVCNETPLTLAFEVTEPARKLLLRAGWSDLGAVPLFLRILDPGVVLANRGRSLPRLVAGAAAAAVRAADAVARTVTTRRQLRLEEVDRFDDRSDAVWAASAPHYTVIARRDAGELGWRYDDFPRAGYYRSCYLYRGDTLVGQAVLRIGEHGGLRAGWIVDFLCPPQWTYGLLSACTRWFRRQGVPAVYCIHQETGTKRAFAAAGFLRRSTGWLLMVKATDLPASVQRTLLEPSNWFITAGDSNVDHPREGTTYAI